jgi:hypothetical protein
VVRRCRGSGGFALFGAGSGSVKRVHVRVGPAIETNAYIPNDASEFPGE